jgi:hypothetical protein
VTTVYAAIKYDFYPDHPRTDPLSMGVDDVEVGVFSTLEAAKRSIDDQYVKSQEEDGLEGEDITRSLPWTDHDEYSWQNEFEGETIIRKMEVK